METNANKRKEKLQISAKKIKKCTQLKIQNTQVPTHARQSLEEIFNNFYYKILYSYPSIGDYYINTML